MTEFETYSWIFLAISISSEKEPVNFALISQIADGINHAIPTHSELQKSIKWLLEKNLINKIGKKYSLTENGQIENEKATKQSDTLLEIWKKLEQQFINYA